MRIRPSPAFLSARGMVLLADHRGGDVAFTGFLMVEIWKKMTLPIRDNFGQTFSNCPEIPVILLRVSTYAIYY
jgi:hypothetical protein